MASSHDNSSKDIYIDMTHMSQFPTVVPLPQQESKQQQPSSWIVIASGAVGGAVSRTLTAPMDRVKTMLQAGVSGSASSSFSPLSSSTNNSHHHPTPLMRMRLQLLGGTGYFFNQSMGHHHLSLSHPHLSHSSVISSSSSSSHPVRLTTVRQVAATILAEGGGLASFWRGNGVNVLKVAPETAIKWMAYERLKRLIEKSSLKQRFVAGAGAGALAQTLIYPLELIKTRMALGYAGQYASIADCAMSVIRAEGPRALYRGLTASVIGIIPYSAVDMSIFHYMKEKYEHRFPGQEPTISFLLASGAISTISGQLVSYPLQLTRTKLQAQGEAAGRPSKYRGVWDCLYVTHQTGGVRGLYRGLIANMMKSVPAMAISYTTFELTRRSLMSWRHEEGAKRTTFTSVK